jgi:hypothetical protein
MCPLKAGASRDSRWERSGLSYGMAARGRVPVGRQGALALGADRAVDLVVGVVEELHFQDRLPGARKPRCEYAISLTRTGIRHGRTRRVSDGGEQVPGALARARPGAHPAVVALAGHAGVEIQDITRPAAHAPKQVRVGTLWPQVLPGLPPRAADPRFSSSAAMVRTAADPGRRSDGADHPSVTPARTAGRAEETVPSRPKPVHLVDRNGRAFVPERCSGAAISGCVQADHPRH